jgi:hypothetical protein
MPGASNLQSFKREDRGMLMSCLLSKGWEIRLNGKPILPSRWDKVPLTLILSPEGRGKKGNGKPKLVGETL